MGKLGYEKWHLKVMASEGREQGKGSVKLFLKPGRSQKMRVPTV